MYSSQTKFIIKGSPAQGSLSRRKGWLDYSELDYILKRERERCDRTGSPFSYVLFNFASGDIENQNAMPAEFQDCIVEFIRVITDYTRECDLKFFSDISRVGILLFDTDVSGAKKYIEKILMKMDQRCRNLGKSEYTGMIQNINLSTYPFQIPELIEDILERPVTGEDYIFTNAPPYNRRERKFGERPDSDVEESPTRNENGRRQPSLPTLLDDISRNSQDKLYLFFKRAIDLICSLVGILLLSPVMLVIAVLIKLTSTGPVLFRQERYGYRGKTFTFLKFRSMRVESNSTIHMDYVKKLIQGEVDEINNGTSDEPLYKITNDPRITPLGRFLRKSSLDELPQLFNVLLGDMSMVGPRPPIPYETRYYKSWHLRRILEVKPGITGIWQVAGRSKTTFDEMVRMDFQYMKNRSLLLDIKLILMTFRAVFDSEGAM